MNKKLIVAGWIGVFFLILTVGLLSEGLTFTTYVGGLA